jgi:5-methylcytosine-specific restriction endonuclease McrA
MSKMHDLAIRWSNRPNGISQVRKLGGVTVWGYPKALKNPGGKVAVVIRGGVVALEFLVGKIEGPQSVKLPGGQKLRGYIIKAKKGSIRSLNSKSSYPLHIKWRAIGQYRYFNAKTRKPVILDPNNRGHKEYLSDSSPRTWGKISSNKPKTNNRQTKRAELRSRSKKDRTWLLATAKAVAESLKARATGTRLRIRIPTRATGTNTDGWSAIIGNLGKGQPRLEVWLDRFSGYSQRKLWACFSAKTRMQILSITKHVDRKLWPKRIVTSKDTGEERFVMLATRLPRSEFSTPILEKYDGGSTFYGIYDPTRETAERVSPHFCSRAVAFFEDVTRALPNAKVEDEQREVYPRYEKRRLVAVHLHRERSKLLATECKIRDDYKCQVCDLRFEDAYGRLGLAFAEAHHLIPLSSLRDSVKTRIEDLKTVCANCHRMLHKMDGKRGDIRKLKTIYKRHSR